MTFTATDGFVPLRQRLLNDLHNEAERLCGELARGNAWAFAPQAEFDALVGDVARLKLRVRGWK